MSDRERVQELEAAVKRYRRRIVELKQLAVQACAASEDDAEAGRTCERGTKGCYIEHDDGL